MAFSFNQHKDLDGKHAFLSPSKYHWVNYTPEKMLDAFSKHMTAALGTRLHAFAHNAIQLGIKLPNNNKTLNMYVNDCIGYRMQTEVPLAYSSNAFGTADAIDFTHGLLRIFDLKNGVNLASEHQLEVYAALFCLEYRVRPAEISYDLRIYQNDEVFEFNTNPEDIAFIMDRIIEFDKLIESAKEEV